jgi:polysaccharide chain length determinant protein (PEP-CTERM system associated)
MTDNPKVTQALEILDSVMRHWWLVVLGLSVGLVGAALALRVLPKTYEAETKIFVAPSRIPLEFVRAQSADDLGMRVASLRESVLSRPYLMKVAKEIYGQDDATTEQTGMVATIAARLDASIIRMDEQRGSGVFSLSYKDGDPSRAANAVNMLANLFIEENVKLRTAQAGTTTKVLDSLASELRGKLEEQEKVIADFKAQHLYDLGDHMPANIQLIQGRQRDLEGTERLLAQEQSRRELLVAQRSMSVNAAPGTSAPTAGPETAAGRLARMKQELDNLKTHYTEAHPLVRAKQREIDDFVALMASMPKVPAAAGQQDTAEAMDPFEAQIAASDREIERLKHERDAIRADIATLQRRIETTPKAEQQLAELTKGYDVLFDRYKNYQTNLENARGSQKVEQARQGEQFQIIEKAVPPLFPVSPAPKIIFPAGLAGGLGLALVPFIGWLVLSPRVRSRQGLKAIADVPVLVSIGSISTRATRSRIRRHRAWGTLATVASVLLLVAAVLVMPR